MAQSGTRVEDKQAASAQLSAATAQMREARKRLADCQLRAPISGFIGMRQIEVGDTVAPGVPVFSVVDLDPVKVRVGIPEAEVGKVREGARAEVSIPSLDGQQFEGRVEAIAAASDPASRTYVSKIVVPNPKRELRAGMVSEAHLIGDTQMNAITLPGSAIVRDERGVTQVFVLAPGQNRVYGRRVEVGSMIGNEVEIRSGLNGNEQVVVDGQQNVREGSIVKIEGGVPMNPVRAALRYPQVTLFLVGRGLPPRGLFDAENAAPRGSRRLRFEPASLPPCIRAQPARRLKTRSRARSKSTCFTSKRSAARRPTRPLAMGWWSSTSS